MPISVRSAWYQSCVEYFESNHCLEKKIENQQPKKSFCFGRPRSHPFSRFWTFSARLHQVWSIRGLVLGPQKPRASLPQSLHKKAPCMREHKHRDQTICCSASESAPPPCASVCKQSSKNEKASSDHRKKHEKR